MAKSCHKSCPDERLQQAKIAIQAPIPMLATNLGKVEFVREQNSRNGYSREWHFDGDLRRSTGFTIRTELAHLRQPQNTD